MGRVSVRDLSGFPRQYHSTIAVYSNLKYLPPALYDPRYSVRH